MEVTILIILGPLSASESMLSRLSQLSYKYPFQSLRVVKKNPISLLTELIDID